MIVSETRERFIATIAERLSGAEVMEAHFFAPRRQGGVESAIAVIAARATAEGVEAEPDHGRFTIFSATYRYTIKGPDRGKWEVTVRPEADAPLLTVDEVVRGVHRRAEDTDDVWRMSGDEFRAAVAAHPTAP